MPASLSFGDTPQMQALLRKCGVYAVRQNGIAVVRDDMKGNAGLIAHVGRRPQAICAGQCGGNGGGNNGDPFAVSYDGVSIGSVSSVVGLGFASDIAAYPYSNAQDQWDDFAFALFMANSGTFYGPYYSVPQSNNCVGQMLEAIGSAISGLFTWLATNAIRVFGTAASNVVFWAKAALAGELTIAEAASAILAVLSSPELLAAIAAVGLAILTVAAIYEYIQCMRG